MAESSQRRKLAAILSADVVGYSKLMADDESATVETLSRYRTLVETIANRHEGRVVNAPGDNILVEFASAVESVQAAVEIQTEIEALNAELSESRRMRFRIGLNLGDVIIKADGTIYGDGVNIAARMEALAKAGGICISGTIHDAVEGKLGFGFGYLGERPVKNIDKPVRVYRVLGEPEERPGLRRFGWPRSVGLLVTVGCALVAIGLVMLWQFRANPAPNAPHATSPPVGASIAILPFVNASGDPEKDYLVDGISETLTTDLSRLRDLFVIAQHTVLAYKGTGVDPGKVGRQLGVRHVLQGSVQMSSERLRVNTKLVDAKTGRTVWADRFDRPIDDIFSIQDDIADKIVAALDVNLVAGAQASVWRKTTRNRKAYELYLDGRRHHFRFTREDVARARALSEQALRLDPNFTMAMVQLGWQHYLQGDAGWSDDPHTSHTQAVAWGEKAAEIDPSLADAYALLTSALLNLDRHPEALITTEKAIELGASQADVLVVAAWNLAWNDREDEALKLIERAMRLNPQSPFWYFGALGDGLLNAGRIEEAIEAQGKCVEAIPDFLWCQLGLALAYFDYGDLGNAKSHVKEALRINPALTARDNAYVRGVPPSPERERVIDALHKAGLPSSR